MEQKNKKRIFREKLDKKKKKYFFFFLLKT